MVQGFRALVSEDQSSSVPSTHRAVYRKGATSNSHSSIACTLWTPQAPNMCAVHLYIHTHKIKISFYVVGIKTIIETAKAESTYCTVQIPDI